MDFGSLCRNNWIYILCAIILLIVLGLLYYMVFRKKYYLKPGKEYILPEPINSVAIDDSNFYTISNDTVTKYKKKNGKQMVQQKFPSKQLKVGKMINGDLVIANCSKNKNVLLWLNPNDLSIIDALPLTFIEGTVLWIDRYWGEWWVSTVEHNKLHIYCFDDEFQLKGYWRYPKGTPVNVTGGGWFGEYLCVSLKDSPEMIAMELDGDKVNATFIKKIQVCFEGHGFVFEQKHGHVYVWGILDNNKVVRCPVEMDD